MININDFEIPALTGHEHVEEVTAAVHRVARSIADLFSGNSLDHTVTVSCGDDFVRTMLNGALGKEGYRTETMDSIDTSPPRIKYQIKVYRKVYRTK